MAIVAQTLLLCKLESGENVTIHNTQRALHQSSMIKGQYRPEMTLVFQLAIGKEPIFAGGEDGDTLWV